MLELSKIFQKMVPIPTTTPSLARSLRTRYILAISLIGSLIIAAQLILQSFQSGLDNSGYLINIAGRQRMLSERLVKLAFIISVKESTKRNLAQDEFNKVLSLWENSHRALFNRPAEGKLSGSNSEVVNELFQLLNPKFHALSGNLRCFMRRDRCGESSSSLLSRIDQAQRSYLPTMNNIVSEYSEETLKYNRRVSQIELLLCLATLALLLAESILLFRPALSTIQIHFEQLESSLRRAEIAEFQFAELQRIKVGLVSHLSQEIWSPLNSIIEISERSVGSSKPGDDDRISTYLSLIGHNANRLLFLLQELLNLSETRLEVSQPHFSNFDMNQEMQGIIARLEQLAQAKDVTLDLSIMDRECIVSADRNRLRQLLISILYNSIRYAPSPSRLRITLEKRAISELVLTLRDHNLSAELTVLEKLFHEVHLDTSTQVNFLSDQSLSLTVARQFVKLHGGHFEIRNEPENGSELRVVLPILAQSTSS